MSLTPAAAKQNMPPALFVWLALAVGALAASVPSPIAFNPISCSVLCLIDDDLTGSGNETSAKARKAGNRRGAIRLRVRSDTDRASLLRLTADLVREFGECFPECNGDGEMAQLLQPILIACYEGRVLTADAVIAESGLSLRYARASLDRLIEAGLVVLGDRRRINGKTLKPLMLAQPAAQRGRELLDRYYARLDWVMSGSA